MNPTKLPDSIPNLGLKPVPTAGARKSGGDFASQFLALLFEQQGEYAAAADSRLLTRSDKASRTAPPSTMVPSRSASQGRTREEKADQDSADAAVLHAAGGQPVAPISLKAERNVQAPSLWTSEAVRTGIPLGPKPPDQPADPAPGGVPETRSASGPGIHSVSFQGQAADDRGIPLFSREKVEGFRGRSAASRGDGDRVNPVTAESAPAALRLSQPIAGVNLTSPPAAPDVPAAKVLTAADVLEAKIPAAPRMPAAAEAPPVAPVPETRGGRAVDRPGVGGGASGSPGRGSQPQVGYSESPHPAAREAGGGKGRSGERVMTLSVQEYGMQGAVPERLVKNEPSGTTDQGIRQPVPSGETPPEPVVPAARTTRLEHSEPGVTVTVSAGLRRVRQGSETNPPKADGEQSLHERQGERAGSRTTVDGVRAISHRTPVPGPEANGGPEPRPAVVTGGEVVSEASRARRTEPPVERSSTDQAAAGGTSRREDHAVATSGARSNGAAPTPAGPVPGDALKSTAAPRSVAAPRASEVPAMMFDQLVERFRLEQMPGSTRFTVQLRPEHLGRVEIETRQEGEILTAVIRAEDPQTRQSLEAGLDVLLERLEEAGVEVHRAEITDFQSGNNPDHENRGTGAGSRNRRTSTNRGPAVKESATETAEGVPERAGGVSYFA